MALHLSCTEERIHTEKNFKSSGMQRETRVLVPVQFLFSYLYFKRNKLYLFFFVEICIFSKEQQT